nr:reverse transcriptase domain-containing protein [Tanacetum cinerariifolium]
MIKSSNGDTSFSLTYRTEAVIPAKISMPTLWTTEIDMVQNNEALKLNLDLLDEKREQAAICEVRSKAKMENYYNSKVCNISFKPGDLVYQHNDVSHEEDGGKLGPKWEGPYERFASVKHPQANGLVERANKSLGYGMKARLDKGSKDWMEEIPHVLWAYRTMIKSRNRDTPFSLIYGTKAVIPAEICMPTLWTTEIDMVQNDEALKLNLDLLEEKREQVTIREARSKENMEKYYNSKVRNTSFKPGDLLYQSNGSSHAEDGGKLGPKWEGSYKVTEALASTSRVLAIAVVTTALSISVTAANVNFVLPISVANYGVSDVETQDEASRSPRVVFEKESLETTPEHPTTR